MPVSRQVAQANETIQSTQHSTDTYGYSEAIFALMDLAGFGFAPRIAKLHKQRRYACRKKAAYTVLDYAILPHAYVDEALILGQWNNLLRLMTSIKLKVCTAS